MRERIKRGPKKRNISPERIIEKLPEFRITKANSLRENGKEQKTVTDGKTKGIEIQQRGKQKWNKKNKEREDNSPMSCPALPINNQRRPHSHKRVPKTTTRNEVELFRGGQVTEG